jgi:hypothetical protein
MPRFPKIQVRGLELALIEQRPYVQSHFLSYRTIDFWNKIINAIFRTIYPWPCAADPRSEVTVSRAIGTSPMPKITQHPSSYHGIWQRQSVINVSAVTGYGSAAIEPMIKPIGPMSRVIHLSHLSIIQRTWVPDRASPIQANWSSSHCNQPRTFDHRLQSMITDPWPYIIGTSPR